MWLDHRNLARFLGQISQKNQKITSRQWSPFPSMSNLATLQSYRHQKCGASLITFKLGSRREDLFISYGWHQMSCSKLVIYVLSFKYLLSATVPRPRWSSMSMSPSGNQTTCSKLVVYVPSFKYLLSATVP